MVIYVLTAKQVELLALFRPFEEITFSELKKRARERSNNRLQQALAAFEDEGVIRKRGVANVFLYSLELANPRTHHYLGLVTETWLGNLPGIDGKEIRRIRETILRTCPFSSIVLFGSFADGTQTKKSDIDVAVFTNEDAKPIELAIGGLRDRHFREMDLWVINKADFQEMLANEEFNLGKEIRKKHRPLHNAAGFYECILSGRRPPARVE